MTPEEYKDRLYKMQRLHKELEATFLEVNKIIPYDQNKNDVYSPRYVFLLQDASRQVDGLFKLLYARLQTIEGATTEEGLRFCNYYDYLNDKNMLYSQKVAPRDDVKRVLVPFRFTEQSTPKWWQAYNDTKHDLPDGESFGKLGYVLNAMGAVAILHDIAQYLLNEKLDHNELLDGSKWHDNQSEFQVAYERTLNQPHQSAVVFHDGMRQYQQHKSLIFYYLSVFSH